MMERKQKEQLQILLKARKRADKRLAERRLVEQKKQQRKQLKAANQKRIEQYTRDLTALAQESGILALAEQAALQRGGSVKQRTSCYIDYGMSTSRLHRAVMSEYDSILRASHLEIKIDWRQGQERCEAEFRIHKNGQITAHNFFLPVFSFLWRRYPQLVHKLFNFVLEHPRHSQA